MRSDSTNEPLDDETERSETTPQGGSPILDPDEDLRANADEFDDDDNDDDDDLDDDDFDVGDEARTVLITGALGDIGRKLWAAWDDEYDLILIDSRYDPDAPEVIQADLSVLDESWITHFHGVDTVIHLAASSAPAPSFEEMIGPNVDAMANVFNAAALAGVERIVFASSIHVAAGRREENPALITVEMPPRPSGMYGALKYVGERLGRSLAEAFDLTFIALRIGFVQVGPNRSETLEGDWDKKMWLSNGDLVRLFDAAVEAEIEDRQVLITNGVSRNRGTPWDLTVAAEVLGYLPEDDAYADRDRAETVDERS